MSKCEKLTNERTKYNIGLVNLTWAFGSCELKSREHMFFKRNLQSLMISLELPNIKSFEIWKWKHVYVWIFPSDYIVDPYTGEKRCYLEQGYVGDPHLCWHQNKRCPYKGIELYWDRLNGGNSIQVFYLIAITLCLSITQSFQLCISLNREVI